MNLEQGKRLVNLAREAISKQLKGEEIIVDDNVKKEFSEKQGVFVTLTKHGELRGCIGFPEPIMELWKAVVEAAQSAAFSDPRFEPISEEEFRDASIEVSVLTKPKRIEAKKPEEYLKMIRIGEDGLIIRSMYGSGLLLPQVFSEYNATPDRALEMTCQKAGLHKEAWKEEGVEVYSFQAQIFSEEGDRVVEKRG